MRACSQNGSHLLSAWKSFRLAFYRWLGSTITTRTFPLLFSNLYNFVPARPLSFARIVGWLVCPKWKHTIGVKQTTVTESERRNMAQITTMARRPSRLPQLYRGLFRLSGNVLGWSSLKIKTCRHVRRNCNAVVFIHSVRYGDGGVCYLRHRD